MPMLATRPTAAIYPSLDRESISWRAVGETVEVSIEIWNDEDEATEAGCLIIEAAPFGAFVPNVPVTAVAVGALDPGERRTVQARIPRTTLDALAGVNEAVDSFRKMFDVFTDPSSPHHWIGNLNVYFDRTPEQSVERHCAFGLRVPCGCRLGAMFMIKDSNECEIEVECSDPQWTAEVGTANCRIALLTVLTPPESKLAARVVAHVKRRRDGRTVPVEFEFETVAGRGDTLGCVQV